MEDEDNLLEMERRQIEQIRELDFEELQVEEVDDYHEESDDNNYDIAAFDNEGASISGELTFNTSLASLHTYLGEVEETHRRLTFLDGGAILTLPIFYLEGAVLFPEAILPLRVIYSNFVAAIERAMRQVDNNNTIAVLRIARDHNNDRVKVARVGTTAEIRQYRRLEDGSINVVTRGQQRFHLRQRWIDADRVPCAEVQIIQEDMALRTPRDVVGKLEPLNNLQGPAHLCLRPSNCSHVKRHHLGDDDSNSEGSFESELSQKEKRLHRSAISSYYGGDMIDESTSSDDEKFISDLHLYSERCHVDAFHPAAFLGTDEKKKPANAGPRIQCHKQRGSERYRMVHELRQLRKVSRAFWPYWVYSMYDSYHLAQRAAETWKRVVGIPNMDVLVKKPDLLSYHIGSKIPLSETIRQELLEIDGISYRLRREIELLESFDRILCKICQTVIARRSDMLIMSNEGPVGAYVNPHGYVHEIMTLLKVNGLALLGHPVKEYSWFPGYAWTIANCATCETSMGWLFTATEKRLKPRMFWGIRSSQVADDTC